MRSPMGQGYVFWPVQGCRLPREKGREVQGEARFGPCRSLALLPGGWYTARIHGPWEHSGEDSGPWNHPMISVHPQHQALFPATSDPAQAIWGPAGWVESWHLVKKLATSGPLP